MGNLSAFYIIQADEFGGIEDKMLFCSVIFFVSARETYVSRREMYVSGREMKKLTKEINFCKAVWKQKQDWAERKVVKRMIKGWIVKKQKQDSKKTKAEQY